MKNSIQQNLIIALSLIAISLTQVACDVESSARDILPPPPPGSSGTDDTIPGGENPTDPSDTDNDSIKIGEENFELGSSMSVSYESDGTIDMAYMDYLYSASAPGTMYISSEVLQMTDACEASGGRLEYIWYEVNDLGEVVNEVVVTDFDNFYSDTGKNYIFRIAFKGIRDCGYVSVSAAVSGF